MISDIWVIFMIMVAERKLCKQKSFHDNNESN